MTSTKQLLLKLKKTPALIQVPCRWVSRHKKRLGAFYDLPEYGKFFAPPEPYEPLFYPILEVNDGKIENRIDVKEYEFKDRRRDPEPYLGEYCTRLKLPDTKGWLPKRESPVLHSHTKLYLVGMEQITRERYRFTHETLDQMVKVLKTLNPDVVAAEAYAYERREFDALTGRRYQYLYDNDSLLRYSTILEKAARLDQHVALIDRPQFATFDRLLTLNVFRDKPNMKHLNLSPNEIAELSKDFSEKCPDLAHDPKHANFYRGLYARMKVLERDSPKIYKALFEERAQVMTSALQRLFIDCTKKKAAMTSFKHGDKYQAPAIVAFVDKPLMIEISKLWPIRIEEEEILHLTKVKNVTTSPFKTIVLRYMPFHGQRFANWTSDDHVEHAYWTYVYAYLVSVALVFIPLLLAAYAVYVYTQLKGDDLNDKKTALRKYLVVAFVVLLLSRKVFQKKITIGAY